MTSFIVASNDKHKKINYIQDFLQNERIDKLDVTYIGVESSKNNNSIGIDEIKNLQVKIFLKPIKSEKKAIVIEDGDHLTIEAQNALLKVLEEPPDHTIIILNVENIENLLPTIISRCQIVTLQSDVIKLEDQEKRELQELIADFSTIKVGERLKFAESISKDKDKAIDMVGKLILILREQMLNSYSSSERVDLPADRQGSYNLTMEQFNNRSIRSFQELYIVLKTTNVNPRFAIENTLLNITS